jgi:hypothetical protein
MNSTQTFTQKSGHYHFAILPIVETYDSEWKGQEYLGLYPVIEKLNLNQTLTPFVRRDSGKLQLLREFGDTYFTSYSMS